MRGKAWIRRAAVAASVIASLCAGVLALPHNEGLNDFACSPAFVTHDESAHYIGDASSSPAGEPQHCFLCHSLRSFFLSFETYEQLDRPIHAEHPHAGPIAVAGRLEWSLTPGRAPPA